MSAASRYSRGAECLDHGRLQGRRAFVTGGAAGIGAAIVRLFSAEGAHVVAADLTPADADPRAPAVGPIAFTLDVTDFAAASAVIDANGPFDILVNNAGADQHAFFTETTPADWRWLLAVNLEAVFACTHAVLPGMQAARYGRIINIASEAGRQGSRGGAIYAAAKGGVIASTKSIARENARYGITANVIAPGPTDTPMLQRAVTFGGPKILETMRNSTLLGRLGTPREIAPPVPRLRGRVLHYWRNAGRVRRHGDRQSVTAPAPIDAVIASILALYL